MPFRNPAWYIEQLDPDVYLNRDYAPLAQRLHGYLGYARAIPKIAAAIRANLKTPLPASFIQRGIDGFGGFASFYRQDVAEVFAAVADPPPQQRARRGQRRRRPGDGRPEELARGRAPPRHPGLRPRRAAVPARCCAPPSASTCRSRSCSRSATRISSATPPPSSDACALYLPHGTLAACVQKMNADKARRGAVEGARAQLAQLRAFVVAKNIVTIPSDEQAQVAEAPPYNRANTAYINIPGPYEHGVAYVYNIAPPDPAWSAAERAAYVPGKASLLYTSVHEVWPGHFQQFLHSNRSPSKIAALWVGYAYAEGWAHYAEELMWEEGLGEGDAESHVGQLVNALERNVRYLCAIGLHTQGMSLADADRMFRERAFLDAGTARQQAARGTYDSQYLKYTLGKLMIRKLRADWVAQQPGAPGSEAVLA